MGLTLFDRIPGDVAATKAGKEFLERANRLLLHANGVAYDMSLLRDGLAGKVAFGMGPFMAATMLHGVLSDLADKHQGLEVRIEMDRLDRMLEQLTAERIDFLVEDITTTTLAQEFVAQPLVRLRLSLFVKPDHPLMSKMIRSGKELLGYPIVGPIMAQGGSSLESFKEKLGIGAAENFQLRVQSENISVLKRLAIEKDVILFAPCAAVATECAAEQLTELALPKKMQTMFANIYVVRLANRNESPAVKVVIKILERLAKECQ